MLEQVEPTTADGHSDHSGRLQGPLSRWGSAGEPCGSRGVASGRGLGSARLGLGGLSAAGGCNQALGSDPSRREASGGSSRFPRAGASSWRRCSSRSPVLRLKLPYREFAPSLELGLLERPQILCSRD